MFAFLAHSPFGFWAIAFGIVVADSILLASPNDFTYTIGNRLRVRVRIGTNPYLLRGRKPIISLFAYPLVPFFVSSADQPAQGKSNTRRLLVKQKRSTIGSKDLTPFAFVVLLLLCAVGPFLSLQYGIDRSLLLVLPALYIFSLSGFACLWFNRTELSLHRNDLIHLGVELMICPVLFVNIFKKLAARQQYSSTLDLIEYFSNDRVGLLHLLNEHHEATAG